MGQEQSRAPGKGTRQRKRQSRHREDDDYYDPYRVLNLEIGATLGEVERAYKRLARKHHPDKGGDPEKFNLISQAYTFIVQEMEDMGLTQQAVREEKKVEKQTYSTEGFSERKTHKDLVGLVGKEVDGNFNEKFNRVFEDVKGQIDDPWSRGYQATEDDQSIFKDDSTYDIVEYREPQSFYSGSSVSAFTLDDREISDFSAGLGDDMQFMDFKRAHHDNNRINYIEANGDAPLEGRARDINELKRERENMSLSKEEIIRMNEAKERERMEERDRMMRLQMRLRKEKEVYKRNFGYLIEN